MRNIFSSFQKIYPRIISELRYCTRSSQSKAHRTSQDRLQPTFVKSPLRLIHAFTTFLQTQNNHASRYVTGNLITRAPIDPVSSGKPLVAPMLTPLVPRVLSDVYSPGFDTMCLHAGYNPIGDDAVYGLGQGAPRGVPLNRTTSFQVRPISRFAIAAVPPCQSRRNLNWMFRCPTASTTLTLSHLSRPLPRDKMALFCKKRIFFFFFGLNNLNLVVNLSSEP